MVDKRTKFGKSITTLTKSIILLIVLGVLAFIFG